MNSRKSISADHLNDEQVQTNLRCTCLLFVYFKTEMYFIAVLFSVRFTFIHLSYDNRFLFVVDNRDIRLNIDMYIFEQWFDTSDIFERISK
jgi:hypothetical protein